MHLPYIIISVMFLIGATGLYGTRWLQTKEIWEQQNEVAYNNNLILEEFGVENNENLQQVSLGEDLSIYQILSNKSLHVPKSVITLIKQFNPIITQAYKNAFGRWAIGYGHVGGISPKMKVSYSQADKLLHDDLKLIGENVKLAVNSPLNENEYGALVSYFYSLSISDVKDMRNKEIIFLLRKGNKEEAALILLNDLTAAKGRGVEFKKVLRERRTQEYLIFVSN